ncbi:extracellular calcium-sensing receptor-like [Rhinophrynus dorsalis]
MSDEDILGYSSEGDIIVGGLFSVHMDVEYSKRSFTKQPQPLRCSKFHIRYYRFLLAMIYAIIEINQSSDLLPNITLGLKLYDSCYNEVKSLKGAKWILSGQKNIAPNFNCNNKIMPSAIVGDMPSKASMPVARILGLYRYPQVSYASAQPLLSDKTQFPSFLRTIYNGNYEVFAIAQIVKFFRWTWVGIISSDSDLGRSGNQLLTKEIEINGACIAFQETLPIYSSMESVFRIIDVIKKSRATVIIVYCTIENLISLMEEASFHNITDKVWIGTTSWSISSDFPRKEILTTLNGSLGLSPQIGKIPGFKEFLYSIHPSKFPDDIFVKTFWETAFNCVWPTEDLYNNTAPISFKEGKIICTGKERLESIDPFVYDAYNFKFTYKTHNAVFAVAHALHQMNICVPGKGPFKNGSCADIFNHQPWQVQ